MNGEEARGCIVCFWHQAYFSSTPAKSLFQNLLELKVGKSEVFPSKMVEFRRGCDDALVLDDVRDFRVSSHAPRKGSG